MARRAGKRYLEISLHGSEQALSRYAGVMDRLRNLTPAWASVMRRLEDRERRLFDRAGGRLVDTGRLRDSLTGRGSDAIREMHGGNYLRFGSSVPYAKYRRRALPPLKPRERKQAVTEPIAAYLMAEGTPSLLRAHRGDGRSTLLREHGG